MTDDMTIQKRVIDELEWSVLVDATHIGVAVRQGIVELTGHVETYAEAQGRARRAWREGSERRCAGDHGQAPQP